jgi:trans-aconitate methyltransferase
MKYHQLQWTQPKESTIAFEKFLLKHIGSETKSIVDLGCGAGAATSYLAQTLPYFQFLGIDIDQELVDLAHNKSIEIPNVTFKRGDWFDLPNFGTFELAISLQTLSWLPEFEQPIRELFQKFKPEKFLFTSLFYDGDISAICEINEFKKDRKVYYNTYSLPALERFVREFGYTIAESVDFVIPKTLEKGADVDIMGTYTLDVMQSSRVKRLQISGPLLLNWKMLAVVKL